jgi:hypothetical protein
MIKADGINTRFTACMDPEMSGSFFAFENPENPGLFF